MYQAKNSGRNKVVQLIRPLQEVEEESFLKVVWSSKFESGDQLIDNQHKKLFDDFNQIFATALSLKSKDEQLDSIMKIVKDLKEHFSYEEEVLSKIGYPEISYHAASHSNLLNNVEIFINRFKNDEVTVIEVLNFLIFEVISDHLYRQDRLYFEYIQEASNSN